MRPSKRKPSELRDISIIRNYLKHGEGSVLVSFGDTKVLCTASVSSGVPRFLKGSGTGWLTAEYGMLPRSTHERMKREAATGKQSGRTQEIQRLIGRSLRAAVDLKVLGENTINIDCDVLQADGGTRTASITGACIALSDALTHLQQQKKIASNPLKYLVAAVSVGIYKDTAVLDLDYKEDSNADTDLNVVMAADKFIEVQGTAEGKLFSELEMQQMLDLAKDGIIYLHMKQREALAQP